MNWFPPNLGCGCFYYAPKIHGIQNAKCSNRPRLNSIDLGSTDLRSVHTMFPQCPFPHVLRWLPAESNRCIETASHCGALCSINGLLKPQTELHPRSKKSLHTNWPNIKLQSTIFWLVPKCLPRFKHCGTSFCNLQARDPYPLLVRHFFMRSGTHV